VEFKLGKAPARPDATKLKLGTYLSATNLPEVPLVFGYGSPNSKATRVQNWRILGNDIYSNCVWAGAAHETMVWRALAGFVPPLYTNTVVLWDYAAATGFDPKKPETDNGTDLQQAAAYRRKTGTADASGLRHKIDIYAALRVGDVDEIALATHLFGTVGIGVDLPNSAMDQFNRVEPWSVVSGSTSIGGHYFNVCGRNSLGNYLVVTWGRLHAVEPSWLAKFMDEGLMYSTFESLNSKNLSPDGFDYQTLMKDLKAITANGQLSFGV